MTTETDGPRRGVRALTASDFSLEESIGGVRGLTEALAPGLVFVVVFVVTRELAPTLIASTAVALVAVVIRLIQRTPLTQALSGIFGVAIGVVWAWRTGDANDYFAFGLWTNGAYLLGCLVSILVRWPVVGVVVELLTGRGTGWRSDKALVRRYAVATWLWVALFGVRLLVQLPLFLDGGEVGWLGTARLVMGVPLWALTLWLTWVLVRRPGAVPDPARPHPAP